MLLQTDPNHPTKSVDRFLDLQAQANECGLVLSVNKDRVNSVERSFCVYKGAEEVYRTPELSSIGTFIFAFKRGINCARTNN